MSEETNEKPFDLLVVNVMKINGESAVFNCKSIEVTELLLTLELDDSHREDLLSIKMDRIDSFSSKKIIF